MNARFDAVLAAATQRELDVLLVTNVVEAAERDADARGL